jgi:V/A-type H+-transporting ATPase subunit E
MAYEELIHSMEMEAHQRLQEVGSQAGRYGEERRASAREEARSIRNRLLVETSRRFEVERHQRLYRVREETKAGDARIREGYLQRAMDLARERLELLREGDGYVRVLEALTREGLEALAEPGARVHLDPRDKAVASEFFDGLPGNPELIDDLDTIGGVIVDSADGRIRVDNTFATRLVRAGEVYRRELYGRLFGSG